MDLLMEHKWVLLVGAEASFWLLSGLFLVLRYWVGLDRLSLVFLALILVDNRATLRHHLRQAGFRAPRCLPQAQDIQAEAGSPVARFPQNRLSTLPDCSGEKAGGFGVVAVYHSRGRPPESDPPVDLANFSPGADVRPVQPDYRFRVVCSRRRRQAWLVGEGLFRRSEEEVFWKRRRGSS